MRKEIVLVEAGPRRPQLERLFRQMMLTTSTATCEGGNARLAVYRDSEQPTFVARIPRHGEQMPSLSEFMPDMRHYLLDYPKPVPTVDELVPLLAGASSVSSRRSDQSRGDRGREERRSSHRRCSMPATLLDGARAPRAGPAPVAWQGFWFVTVNRSRSDGLSGFVGCRFAAGCAVRRRRGCRSSALHHEDDDGEALTTSRTRHSG